MTQPTKWSAPLGSGADVQDLPDDDLKYASFSKIFPQITQVPLSAGGVAPRRVDFNSLFKLLADNIYYYQNGGVFEYSDTADYERGAFVKYNNELYQCIQDNSALNKHTPTDAEYWKKIALNSDLVNYLPLAGGNITGNLTVQNKNVVRSVNGVNADAEGNVQTGFPSSSFITHTLPNDDTGGSTYFTAPANGFIFINGLTDNTTFQSYATHYILAQGVKISAKAESMKANEGIMACMPVAKGDTVQFYTVKMQSATYKFIYAIGEEP